MSEKILFDTDIGSDIDDAVCLAYLLAQSECDLQGITTVSGESDKRAMLASALCKVAGRDIPIYPGADIPLLIEPQQTRAQQAAALSGWQHERDFPRGQAVEFLRQTIRNNPGEITLLTVGPLTNIGLLFRVDPEIPSLLKGLVMMAGVFKDKLNRTAVEWNVNCDPHAAAIVYQSEVAVHRSIGLDVTCKVTMPAEEVRSRFQADLLKPVLDFAEVWFEEREIITFHDPLAAATIFNSDICSFTKGQVEVELLSDRVKGMTHWQPDSVDEKTAADKSGSCEVAMEVDSQKFFEHYFSVFN